MKKIYQVTPLFLLSVSVVFGQQIDSAVTSASKLSAKAFEHIGVRAAEMDRKIARQSFAYLDRMAKQEAALQKAVYGKDSLVAKSLFTGSQEKYRQLLTTLQSSSGSDKLPVLKEYLPLVDSMHAALSFLGRSGTGLPVPPTATLDAIRGGGAQLQHLEGTWQQARDVETFVRQREQQLASQLTGTGITKQLLSMNKTAFYCQQQMVEYKSLLQDKSRLQEKVLSSLRNSNAFQHFMQKNSYVGRMFQLPENYGSTASLAGLQTKEMIQQRIGLNPGTDQPAGSSADPGQFLQQKVDDGQQQIGQLRSKLRELGNFSGGGEVVMPQFKSNDQKTKTFLKRLEYSINLQTQQHYGIMPATADLGLSIGYKLTSKAIVGLGGSYNIGLGQGLSRLSYTGQGAGIRSYVDIKARGSLWLTGGFEYNYVKGFSSWRDLGNWDQWQKSALFGLSKKFKMSANKNSNIQLLFDALYKQHAPASAPLIFRVGYSFN